ncbi:MAG: hypothetical protein I3270_00275 [Candidatus Moeniiplasma glomeromycotorum]|nr:hypothetical protein [Candidatus Moeniiplasma glomeromycotorum]MCE8162266.1 hypothetical protein [Candidatus Moeniiplasma glomeromycotorum]MCE8166077.1 hypothetical protein [Candidatus Moeniiplasma glomeromycotorum]MCE8166665.1 hypothetical protein [Candidatus Moeniiplasma glomeromycotorum]
MEEIKRRCRFCEKEHFGGQRVCRQCIERERERERPKLSVGWMIFWCNMRFGSGPDLLCMEKRQAGRMRPNKLVKL